MAQLFSNISNLNWQQAVMWLIGGILIYLAVKRDMEPALLLPMGFGAILVNLPLSGAVTQIYDGAADALQYVVASLVAVMLMFMVTVGLLMALTNYVTGGG